jgi:penicillin-binding protein 1A
MRLQRAAEQAMEGKLQEFDQKRLESLKARGREDEFVPVAGALVCMDNRPGFEGYVRAMVGGRDFDKSKFNTATQAKRQPGSSVKPFVWAAALDNGMTAADIVIDEPYVRIDAAGNRWAPQNFTGEFLGPVTLRRALEKSVNIVSIKLVERLGMPTVRSYLHRAGIETPIDDVVGLTIALGTPVVTVLEHCTAYSTFAKGGVRADPTFVTEIKDRDGFRRYRGQVRKEPGAIKEDVAYAMTYLMEGVASWGTGARSRDLNRPRAGKTGTSNDSRDAWFCGYTPDYTCIVWVGYLDNRPLGQGRNYTGGRLACPIWTAFMLKAHEGLPVKEFVPPPGIEFHQIDKETGLAEGSFREVFIRGTEPIQERPEPLEEPEELIMMEEDAFAVL